MFNQKVALFKHYTSLLHKHMGISRFLRAVILLIFLNLTNVLLFSQVSNISRWSVTAGIGPCIFDGDVSQTRMQLFPTSFQQVSYGLSAEYGLTPVWGASFDFYHFPLSGENTNISFYTPLNVVDLNATINLLKIIYPYMQTKWAVIGNLGLGYSFYTSNFRYPDPVNSPEQSLGGVAISIPVAFDLEYNINQSIAIGGKIEYRSLSKDNLEGSDYYNFKGVTNDFIGSTFLYVRYKINEPQKIHIRNSDKELDEFFIPTSVVQSRVKPTSVTIVPASSSACDSLCAAYAELIKKQGVKIDSLANVVSKLTTDTAKKQNTVMPPVAKEPILKSEIQTVTISGDKILSVYFDFDKSDLDELALSTIQKVAEYLKKYSKYKVEIRGYCDFIGNVSYNEELSERRANVVKDELVNHWKIAEKRIKINGNGRLEKPATAYRLNRRCDFYFFK